QTHGAVTDFRGKLVLLAHKGSILSKVGASAKPGAIQSVNRTVIEIQEYVVMKVFFYCDESGAKGYANQDEAF
ncbi:hypothetical protein ACOTCQ_32765, partial [Achromobacter dolens]|uniref:hypothetical protein n=1 Tax=Achromobacter dolens TaxID=1287738 RepID=UPI003B9C7F40